MRQIYDFGQRAIQRVNARIAILVVVVAAGGIAVWQGFAHLPRKEPETGPKKQVATGVDAAGVGKTVERVGASLSDEELPAQSAARLGVYGQAGETADASSAQLSPPATSPYTPADNSAGGYALSAALSPSYSPNAGGGSYGGSYGGTTATASDVPSDPTAALPTTTPDAQAAPPNPYREQAALSPSPYAAATSSAGAENAPDQGTPAVAGQDAASSGVAANSAGNPYASPYSSSPSPYGPPSIANQPSAAMPDSAAGLAPPAVSPYASAADNGGLSTQAQPQSLPQALPQNSLPADGLSASPYASAVPGSAGSGMRSLASSGGGDLGAYRSTSSGGIPRQGLGPTASAAPSLSATTPGERQIEGPQQPAITIEKVSPAEIQVGKPATFDIYLRNSGQTPAHNVVITDHVPARTQFIDAKPQAQQGPDGSLVWTRDVMQPGEEMHIALQVMPQEEGEVGSIAHVTFAAAATSRSICTRPQLTVEQYVAPKVLIGEPLTVAITVSNPGSGPATGVVIEADVPPGLSHVAGSQLEYEVGTLKPLESKRLELTMRAEQAGLVQNTIRVVGEANLAAQHTAQVEVVAPQIAVDVDGPKVRFLERQASYTLQVANTGTAPARDLELVARLPRGMKFVTTDSQGQYDPAMHAVFWSLAELPPAQSGKVKITTLPVEPGEQKLVVEGRAQLGLTASAEQVVNVMQSEELLHTVKDSDEVIEVGSETTYEIRVVNSGTKAATNVRIAAIMPPGIAAMEGHGPTPARPDPTQVVFDPLPRLNPQEEVIYKVLAQGRQPGDHIVRVQLSSDEWQTPVSREESTRVYQDR